MHLQARASRAAALLTKNPSLFCRVMLGKLNSARPMPLLPAHKRINDVIFEYDLTRYRGMAPMYFGSYAPLVVEAMKRYLPPGGVFIDVGANIGYLSAIAAGLVGEYGEVHAFEPVPAYCERLQRLALLNPRRRIIANRRAVGEVAGTATIYVTREPGQNTMVRAYQQSDEIVSTLDVPVVRLDDYIREMGIHHVSMIKIDAEGFELPVLKGMAGYFNSAGEGPPIVCEIAPRAYALQGQRIGDLADYMAHFGYSARDLIDAETRVDLQEIKNVDDVIFLQD
ncbi:MAG TPA: FkbM family methyltransferase [Candidatus Aquilonibacter sp.]|nr:FkbM family methyltransferase [Candidatus Aquilonibacter sp.]